MHLTPAEAQASSAPAPPASSIDVPPAEPIDGPPTEPVEAEGHSAGEDNEFTANEIFAASQVLAIAHMIRGQSRGNARGSALDTVQDILAALPVLGPATEAPAPKTPIIETYDPQVKTWYVVWKGIEVGVFSSWGEAGAQVIRVSGSLYKSFTSHDEAVAAFKRQEARGRVRWLPGP